MQASTLAYLVEANDDAAAVIRARHPAQRLAQLQAGKGRDV